MSEKYEFVCSNLLSDLTHAIAYINGKMENIGGLKSRIKVDEKDIMSTQRNIDEAVECLLKLDCPLERIREVYPAFSSHEAISMVNKNENENKR